MTPPSTTPHPLLRVTQDHPSLITGSVGGGAKSNNHSQLSRAVPDMVVVSLERLDVASDTLIADSSQRSRPALLVPLSDGADDTLLRLCEVPLTTAAELARLARI